MNVFEMGWTADQQAAFEEREATDEMPARVAAEWRGAWDVWTDQGVKRASMAGAQRHDGAVVAVGDWVVLDSVEADSARIVEVLPRRSALTRRAAGRASRNQQVAANLDTVFVVTALDGDMNARRVERYVTAVWDGGAIPVVLLNKADLGAEPGTVEAALAELSLAAPGVEVVAVSATEGEGLEALAPYLTSGSTVALVGSSGVGKSTLVNALTGRDLAVAGLGVDARGKHTTTSRQMFQLEGGALLIDTPGMRELGLVDAEAGLGSAFADVEALFDGCRFRDCAHEGEPGCAVGAAVEDGTLDPARLRSYRKLLREQAFHGARLEGWQKAEARKKLKSFSAMCRARTKAKAREQG